MLILAANKAKIAISISQSQNEWLDNKSKEMGMNKSALISLCINNYMQSQEMIASISDMSGLIKQMQEIKNALPDNLDTFKK